MGEPGNRGGNRGRNRGRRRSGLVKKRKPSPKGVLLIPRLPMYCPWLGVFCLYVGEPGIGSFAYMQEGVLLMWNEARRLFSIYGLPV